MEYFYSSISDIVSGISFSIGLIGVIVIIVGVIQTGWLYCFEHKKVYFGKLRLILNTHLILGLDFFIGKDIIDTFLLPSKEIQWQNLMTLITIITVRIVLSYFLNKEIEMLKHKETKEVLEQ